MSGQLQWFKLLVLVVYIYHASGDPERHSGQSRVKQPLFSKGFSINEKFPPKHQPSMHEYLMDGSYMLGNDGCELGGQDKT